MSDDAHKTPPTITSRLPGPPPGGPVEPALSGPPRTPAVPRGAPESPPAPAPPLVPLPEPAVPACHICGATATEQKLDGVRALVRCEDWRGCSDRRGDRWRNHKPGAGTERGPGPVPAPAPPTSSGAGAGTPPAAPAPAPPPDSGTGADTQPPAAPVPGKTQAAATEAGP